MSTFFTIITPVYNRQDCVAKCIKSIISQSFEDWDMLIINDGSVDMTLSIIKDFQANQPRLKIISYKNNKGVNYARNRGIKQATGRYIIFLDSDDYLKNDALHLIKNNIDESPDYKHYLFRTNDREIDLNLPSTRREFVFKDWLSKKVSGDFTHVISPLCFNGCLFPENFRLFEYINWLRVVRNNKKQLYIPITVALRDRGRHDSLLLEGKLNNVASVLNEYNVQILFFDLYLIDINNFGLINIYYKTIIKTIILGIIIGYTEENRKFIKKFHKYKLLFIFMNLINNKFLGKLLNINYITK